MPDGLSEIVLAIARRHVPADRPGALDSTRTSLKEAGISSLDLVALICDVEASLAITFPSEALSEETFRNAETIAAAAARLRPLPH